MLNPSIVSRAVDDICLLKFPPSESSRPALVRMLAEMCSTDEQVLWLSKRLLQLFKEWPGANEMRAVFCSKFRPRDGVEVHSEAYPDGIPSEKPERNFTMLPTARETRRIEGEVTVQTSDAQMQGELDKLVDKVHARAMAAKRPPLFSSHRDAEHVFYKLSCGCGFQDPVRVPASSKRFGCPGNCGSLYEQWETLSGVFKAVCLSASEKVTGSAGEPKAKEAVA